MTPEQPAEPSPSREAQEAGEDLRQRLDLILVSIAIRTDLSAGDRERLIIEAKRREHALALDRFAAAQRPNPSGAEMEAAADIYNRMCSSAEPIRILAAALSDAAAQVERERDRLLEGQDVVDAIADARREAMQQLLDCASYDALMEGLRFKGWNRSTLDRLRVEYERALAPKPTTQGEGI